VFYDYLDINPEAAHTFHSSMGAQQIPAGLAACDLTGVRTLVDVGGGNGALLADVLADHPTMLGVLAELPEAVAIARPRLEAVADRVSYAEGSFFDAVPAGGDVYVLCRVLHNWRDDAAAAILRRVRASMAPGARLIVLEEFLPEGGAAANGAAANGAAASGAGIVDLLMLVTLEGRDRTEGEYRALVAAAGFVVTDDRRAGAGDVTGVLEAVAP